MFLLERRGTVVDESHFLESIRREPRDVSLRQVYADWLEEQGDVRAEFVRLQVERSELSFDDDPDGRLVPLCDRMMALRSEIDGAWLAELEQPGMLIGNPTPYAATWWSAGVPGYMEADGTYDRFPYERLPALAPERDGAFEWLSPAEDARTSELESASARLERALTNESERLSADGFTMPAELASLVAAMRTRNPPPSCTGCYVNLGPSTPCPVLPRVRLVPFYFDSQYCLAWYAAVHESGGHYVVCTYPGYFDPVDPEEPPDRIEDEIHFVATSVETFLHRWQIENELWEYGAFEAWENRVEEGADPPPYLPRTKPELSAEQRSYLEALRPADDWT